MKKLIAILTLGLLIFSSCSTNKPAYKTAEGKKKLKHYNKLQFGERKTFNQ